MSFSLVLNASLLCVASCPTQGSADRSAHTVPGPEAHDLVRRARGMIVMDRPKGGIEAVQLPGLESAMLREPNADRWPVHSIAGPDARGLVAYVENDGVSERHALEVMHVDGTGVQRIFEAAGDALWEHAAGVNLALDPRGTAVALVARAEGVQFRRPDAYLMEGELEVWNLAKRERLLSRERVLDDTLAWFPDGKELAYTALIEAAEAEQLLRTHVGRDEEFGRGTRAWRRVPVVCVLDVETGESRAVHVGERALVSPDGELLLVRDFEMHWRILDLESNRSRSFEAAGACDPGAIAFVDPNTVLYWAWPTEGSELEYTTNNSPLVGKKQMRALKLVDLRDGRFQTCAPSVDPRRKVSFGAWTPDRR